MSSTESKIRERLQQALSPIELEVIDESAAHAGHAGARASGSSHFRVRIVSEKFKGASPIQRHRMIYEALGELMRDEIHALRIDAYAPALNS